MMKKYFLVNTAMLIVCMITLTAVAQHALKPGFDPYEYGELLILTDKQSALPVGIETKVDKQHSYTLEYRSDEIGLDNRWDLWLRDDNVGMIEIRGTTAKTKSWLENFYAGMVPATGSIQARGGDPFQYKLAENPEAAVHAGWLTGLAILEPTITAKINEYYKNGVKEFILMGHSQGAAITFLLNSYLHYDIENKIPDDIHFKTYNSAAPKPGNLYYAYDYDFINRGGWAFRIVNTADWVPETPISVQTLDDFNKVNPFGDTKAFTASMGWLEGVVVRSVFNKMDRSLKKAQKRLLKYLGFKMYKFVEDYMPGMTEPTYVESMNYVPAGSPIILVANENYEINYVKKAKQTVFVHHFAPAYYFLLKEHYFKK